MTNNLAQTEEANDSKIESVGNFTTGLVIGALAAATSYFLSQTAEGAKLKNRLQDLWTEVKEQQPRLTKVNLGDLPLTQLMTVIFGSEPSSAQAQAHPKLVIKAAHHRLGVKKSRPAKFKGLSRQGGKLQSAD